MADECWPSLQISSAEKLHNPLAFLKQISRWIRFTFDATSLFIPPNFINSESIKIKGLIDQAIFSNHALSSARISRANKDASATSAAPLYSCIPAVYGHENEGDIPILVCNGNDVQAIVFLKNSNSNAVSKYTDGASAFSGDIYDVHSCHPIEFQGSPSVYCEGEKTSFVYTPSIPKPPLEDLSDNIMLGAVITHIAYSSYAWIRDKIWGTDKTVKQIDKNEDILNEEYFYSQISKIQTILKEVDIQVNKRQEDASLKNLKWITWGIEDFHDDVEDLITLFKKGLVTKKMLDECRDDVQHFSKEVKDEFMHGSQLSAKQYYQDAPHHSHYFHPTVPLSTSSCKVPILKQVGGQMGNKQAAREQLIKYNVSG